MDSATYKALTCAPDFMRAAALLDSAAALRGIDDRLAERVLAQTRKPPLARPARHTGGPHDDFFQVELSISDADEVIDALLAAEAGAVASDGTTTPRASEIGGLVALWQRYLGHVRGEP